MSTTIANTALTPGVEEFLPRSHKLLIGGRWVDSASGQTFPVENPADESEIARVARGNEEDVDRAVAAARKAVHRNSPWRKMTSSDRGRLLWKLADAIEARGDDFAQLESLDNGKPVMVAKGADVLLTVDHFRYYAGWTTKIHGETIPISVPYAKGARFLDMTLREPVGVVGQIIPWNFPLLMAAWKLGVALACGNTVVLKPAEQTPLSALLLGEVISEVGFPEGVVNIITGFGDAGAALSRHPDVDKVAFTGSTEVGHEIVKASAGNLKKVSLELGGKSPSIVFDDADLEQAAQGVADAIFFNQGQCCCAGSRIFAGPAVHEELTQRVSDIASKIRIGNGMNPRTQLGPLVSREQYDRVRGYIETGATSDGAKVLTGGLDRPEGFAKGHFVKPTVFGDARQGMKVVEEEIFGPVVCIQPFETIEDAIDRGNATSYGLAASVWTKNIDKAHTVAAGLEAGTVWINCHNIFDAAAPFGGYKMSGYGREMGQYAIEMYTQVKNVIVNLG